MRLYRIGRHASVLAFVLALAAAAPLQASEYVPEGTTEAVVTDIFDDTDLGDVILPGDEALPVDTDTEETAPAGTDAAAPEDAGITIMSVDAVDQAAEQISAGAEAPEDDNVILLHVVNGSIAGSYDGTDYDSAETPEISVRVTLGEGRTLPPEVSGLTARRTNGVFNAWYTQAPIEKLVTRTDGEGMEYSVWHTEKTNGDRVLPGEKVPEGVQILYAVFNDKEEEAPEEADQLITYYLDWNGIDGLFGPSMTCIRSYKKNGEKTRFTADDAAVFGLNYEDRFDDQFEHAGSSADKWAALKKIWGENQFNGYTFKGWSTQPVGGDDMIWEDTEIVNGMSFYAQWEKDGQSNATFERVDPDAGPLEHIRILGDALNTNLSGHRHAGANESFTLTIFRTPIRSVLEEVEWKLTVSRGKPFYKPAVVEVTVRAGEPEASCDGLRIKAEDTALTITNTDGGEYGITVDVTAKGTEGQSVSAPAQATLSFSHTWDQGETLETATCLTSGKIHYTCTAKGCEAEKDETVSALGHVYDRRIEGSKESYNVITEPSCTEAGEKQFICLRCKDPNGPKASIPALGHDWKEGIETPVSCDKNMFTRECRREGCTVKEASLVPAYNPELHSWAETDRYHNTCMSDTVYEKCTVCGETRHYTESANNPDRHAYAYESRMRIDCTSVMYTFRCVHGCGSAEVKLVKEEGHDWSTWKTVKAPTLAEAGEQTRTCGRCGAEESRTLPQLAVGWQNGRQGSAGGETGDSDGDGEKSTEVQDDHAAGNVAAKTGVETGTAVNSAANADVPESPVAESAAAEADAAGTEAATAAAVGSKADTEGPENYAAGNDSTETGAAADSAEKTGWQKISGKKYYFDKNGEKKTGWQKISGKKYYFDKNGVMKTGWQKISGKKYYFGTNGVMRTGWQKISGKKYYFGTNGVMRTGWQKIGGKKYYFGKNGMMRTGSQKIGGKKYTFGKDGALK